MKPYTNADIHDPEQYFWDRVIKDEEYPPDVIREVAKAFKGYTEEEELEDLATDMEDIFDREADLLHKLKDTEV